MILRLSITQKYHALKIAHLAVWGLVMQLLMDTVWNTPEKRIINGDK